MEHSFDIEIAKEYGIQCAIILKNIYFWIEKNKANDKHLHDGKYWTYNSIKAMTELFPYMSKNTINRALSKLEEEGLIITGNFNGIAYDRTKWYALTDLGYCVCEKAEIDLPKSRNGITQSQKPIPYINTNDKPNNKYIEDFEQTEVLYPEDGNYPEDSASPMDDEPSKKKKAIKNGECYDFAHKYGFDIDDGLMDTFIDFYRMRKSIKKPLSDRAVKMLKNKLVAYSHNDIETMIAIMNQSIFSCWQDVYRLKQSILNDGNNDSNIPDQSYMVGGDRQ